MLYARWQQVAAERAAERALTDVVAGRAWTFRELAAAGHRHPLPDGPFAVAAGSGAAFVLAVLAAWRDGRILCALEPGQSPPESGAGLPPGVVHLKRTSGSSGAPRWVMFTADQLAADVGQIVTTMGLRADWPNLGVLSLAHSYGFSSLVLPLLLHGIPLCLAASPLPESVRAASAGFPGLTLPGVPAMWRTWAASGSIPSSTRLALSAGASLPVDLEREIHGATGIKIHNFYGASECGGIAYDRTPAPRGDGAIVGTPMDGVAVRVDGDGQLEVRSPAVGLGTWPEPDDRLSGGVFRPGDLARLGEDGLRLLGRVGDVINVAGRKLLPEAVEGVLRRHPDVRDCVVVGIPASDPGRGEEVAAVVALRAPRTERELRAHLLQHLPAWQVPRSWRFDDALAPDLRGKLSRAVWRRAFGSWDDAARG